MVLGDLVNLTLPQKVDARVANVRDKSPRTDEQQAATGGSHAALVGIFLGAVKNLCSGGLDRVLKDRQDLLASRGCLGVVAMSLNDIGILANRSTDRMNGDL